MNIGAYIPIIILFVLGISTSNCSDGANRPVLFYWQQTLCLDPWGTGENDTEADTKTALLDYLSENRVKYSKIVNYENTFEEGTLICNACSCWSGIVITVETSENYSDKMEEIGFTLTLEE